MLPEGIRNASTRKVRSTIQTTSAIAMDLVQSQQPGAEGSVLHCGLRLLRCFSLVSSPCSFNPIRDKELVSPS